MADWTFLTNHARALLCIAGDPGIRLRDIAAELSITERHAYGIVADLTEAGYLLKEKDGRRNRYRVRTHLPLRESSPASAPSGSCWLSSRTQTLRRGRAGPWPGVKALASWARPELAPTVS